MMELRLRSTGQIMHEHEFRAHLRNNNGPTYEALTLELAEELGVDIILEGPQAQPTRYQIAFRDGIEQIEGKWYTKYSVSDLNAEAVALKDAEHAKSVRAERDRLLSETDWRFRSDLTPSQTWKDYCQALRDVPTQEGFPWEVKWPDKP